MKAAAVLMFFGVVVASVAAISFVEVLREEWEAFKMEHMKSYGSDIEEKFRMKIYTENRHKIAKHNKMADQGHFTYKLKLNKYSDLLTHEFVHLMNGYNKSSRVHNKMLKAKKSHRAPVFIPPFNVTFPKSIDWRTLGAVTDVKNQGPCGSCWSFSATGSLEGQHFRKTGKLVSLSEQNLVDCSLSYGNDGCDGGLMDFAFKYIKDNHGIDTEQSYPYEGTDGHPCRFKAANVGADDVGFVDIPSEDEDALLKALATIGPISVAIDASQDDFQFYSEGVYYNDACSSTKLDHGVLAVGYGTDEKGNDYWLVKNSWGKSWGMDGYIKMARNRHNNCGIATNASYPLV